VEAYLTPPWILPLKRSVFFAGGGKGEISILHFDAALSGWLHADSLHPTSLRRRFVTYPP